MNVEAPKALLLRQRERIVRSSGVVRVQSSKEKIPLAVVPDRKRNPPRKQEESCRKSGSTRTDLRRETNKRSSNGCESRRSTFR